MGWWRRSDEWVLPMSFFQARLMHSSFQLLDNDATVMVPDEG